MLLSKGETTPLAPKRRPLVILSPDKVGLTAAPVVGSPAFRWKEPPFAIASRLERRLNQAQHPAVCHSLSHQRQQFSVIHRPEKVLEVRVHDPLPAALNLLPDFAHGVL